MYKSKLQEYCHSKAWVVPEYGVTRQGPDHSPLFQAAVNVNGLSFPYPIPSKTSKEAQNHAAKIAFDFFTGCSSTSIPTSSLTASNSSQVLPMKQGSPVASCDGANRVTDNNLFKDGTRMYKSQLQNYAQKRNIELPVYSVERVGGPSHASQFKCKVTLEDKTYESEVHFSTIKEAESAVAKVALASIFPGGCEEDVPLIYKNLLQEMFQKENSCLPSYTTTFGGPSHIPVFVSTVEIQGETFKGQEAKTKKQAEMNAAKVAYITLRERKCKQDGSVKAVAVHLGEPFQFPSAKVPEGGSDVQTKNDKQVECKQDNVMAATSPIAFRGMPEASSNTNSIKIQNVKATQSAPEPVFSSSNPSSSISSKPADELHDVDEGQKNKKKKIMVFPQSSTKSHPNAPVVHSNEKWIAFTSDSC